LLAFILAFLEIVHDIGFKFRGDPRMCTAGDELIVFSPVGTWKASTH
jgi:hypothetical protein